MSDGLKLWVPGDNRGVRHHCRSAGKGIGERNRVLGLQQGGLPDDLGGGRDNVDWKNQEMVGKGSGPFLADTPDAEVVDFGEVHFLKK